MKLSTITTVCAAIALVCSCGTNSKDVEQPAIQVVPFTVEKSDCIVEYTYPATLEGVLDVAIYPQVNGRLTKIHVKQGQFVKKGDVLFEIDDVPYKAAYDQAVAQREVALAQVAAAKLTLESKQTLYNNKVISEYQLKIAKIEMMQANSSLAKAEAALQDAKNSLSFTKVRTMSSGYAGPVPVRVGALVGSSMSEPLTSVSDNSEVNANFAIPENIYLEMAVTNQFKQGETAKYDKMPPVTLIMNNGEKYEKQGRVVSISGIISQQTGAIPAKAVFPNEGKQLLSGGSAQVMFAFNQKDALAVPRASIKEIQNKMFLFKITGDTVKMIEVNATRYNQDLWILLPSEDGTYPIQAGDKITTTTNRLQDGSKIVIK